MNTAERRSVIAGLYGNALEWYDFLLYASFAPLFAKLFFPAQNKLLSFLATFGVFAVSFFMRPIGGILLGHCADSYGRRKALLISVTLMTMVTIAIAFLPGYERWGLLASILFTLLRLLQGIAVGGELPGSVTYIIEHMFACHRGLAGSLVLSSAFLGIFAGSLVASVLSHALTYEELLQYGWRAAYLLGGVLGLLGIYLRVKSIESDAFLKAKPTTELPIKRLLLEYRHSLILAIIFTSILAMANYLLIAYVTTFLVQGKFLILKEAHTIHLIALFLLLISIPVMGMLSDKIGRKPIFLAGLLGLMLAIFPIFWLLQQANWWYALGAECILAICLAPLNGTIPTMLTEMFPTEIRASGTSMGYNMAQALFGGTLPLIALTLTDITGSNYAPAWYIFCWIIIVIASTRVNQRFIQKDCRSLYKR